jgi:hypothetical protein
MATSTWGRPPRSRKCPNSPYSGSSIPANLDSSDMSHYFFLQVLWLYFVGLIFLWMHMP